MFPKLPRTFYERDNVVWISRELIGKVLCTRFDDELTTGMIVETEAYNGRTDRACHAYPDVKTARTKTIYGPPGFSYVYLCYGIHHLFNIVTNREGFADAILVRAVEPIEGVKTMTERRGKEELTPVIGNGPGKLTQAMGITTSNDRTDLLGNEIWIEDRGFRFTEKEIEASPRIGVDYAGEDAQLPWRFTMKNSEWVSR